MEDRKEIVTEVLASDSEHEVRKHVLNELLDNIKNTSDQAILKVNEAFNSMVGNIRKVLKSTIDGTEAFFKDLPETIKAKTSELYNSVIDQSSKIWKSMKDGAKDTVGVIRNAFATVLNKLAKVFEATSHLIGEGKTALLAAVGKVHTRAKKFTGAVRRAEEKDASQLKSRRGGDKSERYTR